MASWSTRRKYRYFMGALIIAIVFVAIPLYFTFHKTPTCFDNTQNGKETGIDCGGACARLCPADFATPRVLWSYSMQVVPGVYNAMAYVQNPNPNVETKRLPYTFKLYDSEGILVSQKTGSTFVPAGSRFPVFEGGIQTGSRISTRTTFEFGQNPDWVPGKAITEISILDTTVNENNKPTAEAKIRNISTDKGFRNLNVFIILYDENDNRISFSKTVVDSISPGETKTLYFTWPGSFSKKVVRTELLFVPQF